MQAARSPLPVPISIIPEERKADRGRRTLVASEAEGKPTSILTLSAAVGSDLHSPLHH